MGYVRTLERSLFTVLLALSLVCVFSINAPSQTSSPPSVNKVFSDWINPAPGTDVQIAPMDKAGDPTPGTWSTVPNDLFDGILARSGIIPCVSDPMHMVDSDGKATRGHAGLLQAIDISEVVNSSGTRATFGWFVKFTKDMGDRGLEPFEYFILMSYDLVHDKKTGKDFCAFEVFLFGPIPRVGSPGEAFLKDVPIEGGTPLVAGLVVNGDGKSLDAVPFEIARVSNFRNDASADEQVRPGVARPGEGCMRCHARETKRSPEATTPFPWVYDFNKPPKPEAEREIDGVLNPAEAGAKPPQSAPPNGVPSTGAFSPAPRGADRSRTPSHRATNCESCRGVARRLNEASDALATDLGDPKSTDQQIAEDRARVDELSSMLDSCERTCKEAKSGSSGVLDDVTIGVGIGTGGGHDHDKNHQSHQSNGHNQPNNNNNGGY